MNELLSMLVPLDTLAGWPAAQEPTILQTLGLLVGFPVLAIVIAFAVAKIGTNVQASRGEAAPVVSDSVWVGGRQGGGEIEAAPEMHGVGADDDEKSPGGAGARW